MRQQYRTLNQNVPLKKTVYIKQASIASMTFTINLRCFNIISSKSSKYALYHDPNFTTFVVQTFKCFRTLHDTPTTPYVIQPFLLIFLFSMKEIKFGERMLFDSWFYVCLKVECTFLLKNVSSFTPSRCFPKSRRILRLLFRITASPALVHSILAHVGTDYERVDVRLITIS